MLCLYFEAQWLLSFSTLTSCSKAVGPLITYGPERFGDQWCCEMAQGSASSIDFQSLVEVLACFVFETIVLICMCALLSISYSL